MFPCMGWDWKISATSPQQQQQESIPSPIQTDPACSAQLGKGKWWVGQRKLDGYYIEAFTQYLGSKQLSRIHALIVQHVDIGCKSFLPLRIREIHLELLSSVGNGLMLHSNQGPGGRLLVFKAEEGFNITKLFPSVSDTFLLRWPKSGIVSGRPGLGGAARHRVWRWQEVRDGEEDLSTLRAFGWQFIF